MSGLERQIPVFVHKSNTCIHSDFRRVYMDRPYN